MVMNKFKSERNHEHESLRGPLLMGYADTYVKLAKHRILFVSEDVNDTMAAQISAMLLYFDNESHESNIEMYIHSNGGAVTGLLNIYDVMQMIQAPIKTICIGKCYSAGAVLLSAGTKGERYAFKNSSVMIHGIQVGFPVPGHDMTNSKNYYEFLISENDKLMKILAHHTGHPLEKVREDCKQDVWMDAKQVLEYGIIDHIIG
jgi:ATP-dependent Clp protease protease subunit